jgi:hypothetical protein
VAGCEKATEDTRNHQMQMQIKAHFRGLFKVIGVAVIDLIHHFGTLFIDFYP